METCKPIATPGSKDCKTKPEDDVALDPKNHTLFRSGAGLCQYLSEFRTDMTFSTNEIMREAAKPTWNSMAKLKRLIRYIRGRPRCELAFPWSEAKAATELDIVVDSDWGGCDKTR